MSGGAEPTPREQRLIVAVADGRLDARRREHAVARLARIPGIERLVARQRRVADALQRGPAAPSSLAAAAAAARAPAVVVRARVRSRALLALGAAAAALVVLVAVVFNLSDEREPDPTMPAVAALGERAASESAPAPVRGTPQLLDVSVAGVSFPNWGPERGWHAVGMRDDRIDGRESRTVFYRHHDGRHTVAYTIVAGPPIEHPPGARRARSGGVAVDLYRRGRRDVAMFVRGGVTCVLSGDVERRSTLVELAAWKGRGAVVF